MWKVVEEGVEGKGMKERKDFEGWKGELWRKDIWVVVVGYDEVGVVAREMGKWMKGGRLVGGRYEERKAGGGGGGGSGRKWWL